MEEWTDYDLEPDTVRGNDYVTVCRELIEVRRQRDALVVACKEARRALLLHTPRGREDARNSHRALEAIKDALSSVEREE